MNNMKKAVQQPIRKVYGPSNQQDSIQLNAVKKINSLLSSGAVSVTGPIQPRILKQKSTSDTLQQNYNQLSNKQKCYICDEVGNSSTINLTQASTITTKTKIPNKIGNIVGDAFMVIVCEDDVICNKCMSQFNQLDRFENDVERIKNNILNSIYKKYDINDDETSNTPISVSTVSKSEIPNKFQKINSTTFSNRKVAAIQSDDSTEEILTRKVPVPTQSSIKQSHQNILVRTNTGTNVDSVEHQLSNLFEQPANTTSMTPSTVLQPQLAKRGPIKIYKCRACEFKTQDVSLFQTHFETCKPIPQQHISSPQQTQPATQVVQTGYRCKLCKKLFASLSALKQHNTEKHSNIHETTPNNNDTKSTERLVQHYSCNLCKYETTDKRNYDEHIKKHGKMKPFKCRICAMRFETREQASVHAKTHQPDYFKCGSCAASFPQREMLIKHFATHEKQQTTQKLLQETIDEALRVDNHEHVDTSTSSEKPINFFTCDICAVTFLQKVYYNQHMESKHKTPIITTSTISTNIINTLQNSSISRQNVQTSILNQTSQNQQQNSNTISDADLESIFEKIHSDKTEHDVGGGGTGNSNNSDVSNVVITSQENSVGGITFNITLPQGEEINLDQESKIIQQNQEDPNSQEGQQQVSIDMPVLEAVDDNGKRLHHIQMKQVDENTSQQLAGGPVSMPSLDDEIDTQNVNSDTVSMDLEDVHNSVDNGQIKFIINDGQLLQINDHIITDADGNQILVQDSEHIQQLLQSVGVLQSSEGLDGEALHMINENNQMIIVQQDGSGEAQLIDASMLNADGQIVIQQSHEDDNSQSAGEEGVSIPVSVTYATQPTNVEMHNQEISQQETQQHHEEMEQQQQITEENEEEHQNQQHQEELQEQDQEEQLNTGQLKADEMNSEMINSNDAQHTIAASENEDDSKNEPLSALDENADNFKDDTANSTQ